VNTQGSSHAAAVYFGLQGFEIEDVEILPRPTVGKPGRKAKVVTLRDVRGFHQCPKCGRRHRQGAFQESVPITFRDCSLGDHVTLLRVYPWRVQCCGGTSREALPFEQEGFRTTTRFFERIAALCTRATVHEVAQMADLSWDTVCRMDKKAIELALGGKEPDLDGVRKIGVDEVSRTGGRRFVTIVTDLESGRVIHVGDGKGKAAIQEFVDRLGARAKKIRVTTSDLGYLKKLQEAFPNAVHALDRFHTVKWMNDAVNEVRREVFGGAPDKEPGRTLKVKQWMLLSAREDLDHSDKLHLKKLMELNLPLYQAYLLKEELRSILRHPWTYLGALRTRLNSWCTATIESKVEKLAIVGNRVRKNVEAIIACFKEKVRQGLVEGTNSKIQRLRVQARGYRDKDYFKLKIFQRCSLPNNPWAEIVL